MIKVIIFDLDGVLVDTKMIHYEALNLALEKFKHKKISINDHIKVFDGLPTFKKLEILHKGNKLPKKDFSKINKYKQKITSTILKKKIKKNKKLIDLFKFLHKDYKIAVATNAVKSTLNTCLNK